MGSGKMWMRKDIKEGKEDIKDADVSVNSREAEPRVKFAVGWIIV